MSEPRKVRKKNLRLGIFVEAEDTKRIQAILNGIDSLIALEPLSRLSGPKLVKALQDDPEKVSQLRNTINRIGWLLRNPEIVQIEDEEQTT